MNPTPMSQADARAPILDASCPTRARTTPAAPSWAPIRANSALNKYLQSWDCHNLFVDRRERVPAQRRYNPTGPVGALAYWTADAIKRYVKNPGPLVPA